LQNNKKNRLKKERFLSATKQKKVSSPWWSNHLLKNHRPDRKVKVDKKEVRHKGRLSWPGSRIETVKWSLW
jgi:hypothetical protein